MKRVFEVWLVVTFALVTLVGFSQAFADTYTGTSWKINGNFGASFGNQSGSTSYNLVDTGGESIIGQGSGGSYMLTAGYTAQLQNAIQLTMQPAGLVGYWPMAEASGSSTQDLSINANNALLNGGPTWATGQIGGGLTFASGSSQYVSAANITALQTNTVTAMAWVKTTTTTTGQTIIAKTGAWQLAFSRTTAGRLVVHNQTGDVDVCADTTAINDGNWHHVAMTMSSGTASGTKLYIDGVLKQTCTATVLNQTGGLTIGSLGTSYYLTGTVDEAKVFDRVLAPDEIAAEHSAGAAGQTAGVSLGAITPGASNTVEADIITQTDGSGYTLAIHQDHDLTSGSYTIPAITGATIASPAAWNQGTTRGLGFTLTATNATALPGTWASGASYAALPGSTTSFYTRTGEQSVKDYVRLRLRADVASSQAATVAPYTDTVTVTGTLVP